MRKPTQGHYPHVLEPSMIELNGGLMGIIEGSEDIQDHPLRSSNGSNAKRGTLPHKENPWNAASI